MRSPFPAIEYFLIGTRGGAGGLLARRVRALARSGGLRGAAPMVRAQSIVNSDTSFGRDEHESIQIPCRNGGDPFDGCMRVVGRGARGCEPAGQKARWRLGKGGGRQIRTVQARDV